MCVCDVGFLTDALFEVHFIINFLGRLLASKVVLENLFCFFVLQYLR